MMIRSLPMLLAPRADALRAAPSCAGRPVSSSISGFVQKPAQQISTPVPSKKHRHFCCSGEVLPTGRRKRALLLPEV